MFRFILGLSFLAFYAVRGGERSLNFTNDIVPIFTKASCNSGGCHGKASGQNGFKLSLLGFEPTEDYEHIVKEARGRRVFPAAPDRSLLLTKAVNSTPHGGGKKLDVGSEDYATLKRWISSGLPWGRPDDPTIVSIEVQPKAETMSLKGSKQLKVLARYSDGYIKDVTRSALYEPNDKAMAETTEDGLVKLFDLPGEVAIMVRYQGKIAVFRATIPLGAPVDSLPPVSNFVDELVFNKLKSLGLPPSGVADDSTFLRRVSIDITGRLPSPGDLQAFQSDANPEKRQAVVDRLLASESYADYFAGKWSALLRNKRSDPKDARGNFAFHHWIKDQIYDNLPYDKFAGAVVAGVGSVETHPPVVWYRQAKDTTTQLEDTAQLFLGQRLQCAQCHHHPFEKWSQQDYYGFAAFFSTVSRKAASRPGEEIIFSRRAEAQAVNLRTKLPVKPTELGGRTLSLTPEDDPRRSLATWMAAKDNPFFARSLVNRYWKHFFNRGLIEPEDDMRESNPPANPELLDALAKSFIESGYDLKQLIRTITTSTVYQLSAEPNAYNGIDRQNFSRFYPKRLQAEVLLDAIHTVLDSKSAFEGLPAGTPAIALPDNSYNASNYFLTVFGRPEGSSACECERTQESSLAQSLHLINAPDLQTKLGADKSRPAVLAQDDKRSDEEKITEAYLWMTSRKPNAAQLKTALDHIAKLTKDKPESEVTRARRNAYEDILWALINTKEFLFNH
ncbi:MAG: DUF1553 domain-containing protein [Verrucomicrobiaceae bacterium]|nr:DUF1553 domain-containing protein [Verrucomicrobiaceae bacterium]